MKIQFAKKQYFQLMKVVYLGNWLVNAIRIHDDRVKEIDDIEQYIFSYAKQFHMDKYIEFDKQYNRFFPTRMLEEEPEIMQFIDDYDDHNFWEDLVYKLAHRDFVTTYRHDVIAKMSLMERIEKEQPFVDKYWVEIEEYGLDRLMIMKDQKESSVLNESKVN